MLYLKCPTCKLNLGIRQLTYEQRLENITMDGKLSNNEKNIAKMKLLDDLEIKRMCCRMRVLGYVRLIDIIN